MAKQNNNTPEGRPTNNPSETPKPRGYNSMPKYETPPPPPPPKKDAK